MSKFAEALKSGRLMATGECLPPRGSDAETAGKLSSVPPSYLDAAAG